MKNTMFKSVLILFVVLSLAGCTFIFQTGRRSDINKIEELQQQLDELKDARISLEDKLKQELNDSRVKLQMMSKGLVITFLADVLFEPGKDKIRTDAIPVLHKVGRVLKNEFPNINIGIEGYTDNQPIKYSGWKSNWELSTARALSVLHYMETKEDIAPERLAAIGYGEFKPVASNQTGEGRKLNRRVEIVLLPQVSKIKDAKAEAQPQQESLLEPQENLK